MCPVTTSRSPLHKSRDAKKDATKNLQHPSVATCRSPLHRSRCSALVYCRPPWRFTCPRQEKRVRHNDALVTQISVCVCRSACP